MVVDYRNIVNNVLVKTCLNGGIEMLMKRMDRFVYIKEEDKCYSTPKQEYIDKMTKYTKSIIERMEKGASISRDDMLKYKIYQSNTSLDQGQQSDYHNQLMVVCGNCHFGSKPIKFYEELLERYNRIFSYNGIHMVIIRGNDDNPLYFDGRFNLSNIKLLEDYSVLLTDKRNILCIGGSVSLDREWKKRFEERLGGKKIYWDNECVVYDEDKLNEIVQSGNKVDVVITHTAPSFVEPQNPYGIDCWSENDSTLINDNSNDRVALDKVFNKLRENGITPTCWIYTKFKYKYTERRSGIIFTSVSDNNVYIENHINNFIMNEEKAKKKTIRMKSDGMDMDGDAIVQGEYLEPNVEGGALELDNPYIIPNDNNVVGHIGHVGNFGNFGATINNPFVTVRMDNGGQ